MRQLFHAYATHSVGSVAMPRGGRSGRVALGLKDFEHLAQAAQLRMPANELEAVFRGTVLRFGSAGAVEEELSLAFELFVELLVDTARAHFGDVGDAESTAALFEDHLLPLAQRLHNLEVGVPASARATAGPG